MTPDGVRVFRKVATRRRLDILRLRAAALTSRRAPRPSRPVFLIGCPRSGTTLLFRLLSQHEGVAALPAEGHVLWSAYQHPSRTGWSSDRATGSGVHPRERRYLYHAIGAVARGRRFMDKTPKNVLKVPYLASLFPDASFVFLHRDPRDTIGSLIEGWRAGHGISYRLPVPLRLDGSTVRHWSYVLPPGWRTLGDASVPEVAAFQYRVSNEVALDDLSLLAGDAVVHVSFEDLVARPGPVAAGLLERLGLGPSETVARWARDLSSHHVSTVSPPRKEKWRDRQDEVLAVLPSVAEVAARLGYDLTAQEAR